MITTGISLRDDDSCLNKQTNQTRIFIRPCYAIFSRWYTPRNTRQEHHGCYHIPWSSLADHTLSCRACSSPWWSGSPPHPAYYPPTKKQNQISTSETCCFPQTRTWWWFWFNRYVCRVSQSSSFLTSWCAWTETVLASSSWIPKNCRALLPESTVVTAENRAKTLHEIRFRVTVDRRPNNQSKGGACRAASRWDEYLGRKRSWGASRWASCPGGCRPRPGHGTASRWPPPPWLAEASKRSQQQDGQGRRMLWASSRGRV